MCVAVLHFSIRLFKIYFYPLVNNLYTCRYIPVKKQYCVAMFVHTCNISPFYEIFLMYIFVVVVVN